MNPGYYYSEQKDRLYIVYPNGQYEFYLIGDVFLKTERPFGYESWHSESLYLGPL